MTKEEYDNADLKFGTILYIDGIEPITVQQKYETEVGWMDYDEYWHRTSYDHLYFDKTDNEKELNKVLKRVIKKDDIPDSLEQGYTMGFKRAWRLLTKKYRSTSWKFIE